VDDELYIDPEDQPCMTVRQAAAHFGRSIQTIYGWERAGLIKVRMTDDHGRKVFLLVELAQTEKKVRPRAARVLGSRAA
jgi:predicted site-specific integrase-resolvase